jgi:hypothetical protein
MPTATPAPLVPLLPLAERLDFDRLLDRLDWDRIPLPAPPAPRPINPNGLPIVHGDRAEGYKRGCRCPECSDANAVYSRELRARNRATANTTLLHRKAA